MADAETQTPADARPAGIARRAEDVPASQRAMRTCPCCGIAMPADILRGASLGPVPVASQDAAPASEPGAD